MRKLLGFAFIGGLLFGVIEGWNWLRYRNPEEVAFTSNAVDSLPKHVTLREVFLSPTDIVTQEGKDKPLYVPIRSLNGKSAEKNRPLHFLLKTSDPELVAAYAKLGQQKTLADGIAAMKPLLTKTQVSGMLGDPLTHKQRAKLREVLPVLAEDFTVLEDGRHPSLFTMVFLFGMSAVALFTLSKLDPAPVVVEPPPIPPAEPPPLPRQN